MELLIQPGKLTLADLRQAYLNPIKVKLDESASSAINASVACVEQIVNEGRTAYGINTGFGLLASTKIAPEDLEKLQVAKFGNIEVFVPNNLEGYLHRHYPNLRKNLSEEEIRKYTHAPLELSF